MQLKEDAKKEEKNPNQGKKKHSAGQGRADFKEEATKYMGQLNKNIKKKLKKFFWGTQADEYDLIDDTTFFPPAICCRDKPEDFKNNK